MKNSMHLMYYFRDVAVGSKQFKCVLGALCLSGRVGHDEPIMQKLSVTCHFHQNATIISGAKPLLVERIFFTVI